MAHTELVRVSPDPKPTVWARAIDTVRSIWLGPYNTKDKALAGLFGGPPASAGVVVNEQTAISYAPLWCGMGIISADVGSLPLSLYQRLPNGGKRRYTEPKLYRLLHDEFNPEMSSIVGRETMQAHCLTWGNAYAEIERDQAGRPAALWPITPDRMAPFRQVDGRGRLGPLEYLVQNASGPPAILDAANVLHIPGLGFDGVHGYSVIAKARESIGLGLAAERFGATFFGNGATFGGVISWPVGVGATDLSVKNFKDALQTRHVGVDRAHKFLTLYNGATYSRLGIPPNDAQFLETRKFQVEEQARWLRIPPHKIGAMEHATFSNIEHQDLEFYKTCRRGWLVRWEQEFNRKCVAPSERNIQFIEHNVDGFLRGDIASRYAAYAVGRNWGWLSADDVRERENMNPLPNGQGTIYLVPTNMAPANRLNEIIDKQVAPPPVSAPPPVDPKAPPDGTAAGRAAEVFAAEIRALTERTEAHLARAIAAETNSTSSDMDAVAALDEAKTQREAAADLQRQILALTIAKDEAEAEATRAREAAADETAVVAVLMRERDAAIQDRDSRVTALDSQIGVLHLQCAGAREGQATTEAERARLQAALETAETARRTLEQERDALQAAAAVPDPHLAELAAQAAALATDVAAAVAATAQAVADRQVADDAAVAVTQADQARRVRIVIAHRGLIVDAVQRLLQREADRARKAQASPEKLTRWMDGFYPLHDEVCRSTLRPVVQAWLAAVSSEEPIEAALERVVRQHVETSTLQLKVVLEDADNETLAPALERVLRRWETERAEATADRLTKEIA